MRWFKHMTSTTQDEKIMELLEVGGLEGYGFYWRLIELLALQMDKSTLTCSTTLSLSNLSRQCYLHHNKVSSLLGKLNDIGLITVSKTEVSGRVKYEITCHNLLKYRDEYTSKNKKIGTMSGHNRDNVGIQSGQCPAYTETETETETETKIDNVEPIKPPLTSGKIDKSAKVIQEFATAFGAFTLSEIEKSNVCKLIDKGCTPKDVTTAKNNNLEYMKSLKSEFAMRCVIAAKEQREATETPKNRTHEEIIAEAKRTYGQHLLVV